MLVIASGGEDPGCQTWKFGWQLSRGPKLWASSAVCKVDGYHDLHGAAG